MRKLIITMVLASLLAVPVRAGPTVTVSRTDGYYQGSGGEFTVTPSAELNGYMALYDAKALAGDGFQSFCLEAGEYIDVDGTTEYTAVLNDRAINGGAIAPPFEDKLSVGVAWLYHEFQLGRLDKYEYDAGPARMASAEALQYTIWWLEDEGPDPGPGNVFKNVVIDEFGDADSAKANNNGQYPVAILNLYYPNGAKTQDMLICIPAPGAILLGGIGAGLVGWLRRRRTL